MSDPLTLLPKSFQSIYFPFTWLMLRVLRDFSNTDINNSL